MLKSSEERMGSAATVAATLLALPVFPLVEPTPRTVSTTVNPRQLRRFVLRNHHVSSLRHRSESDLDAQGRANRAGLLVAGVAVNQALQGESSGSKEPCGFESRARH